MSSIKPVADARKPQWCSFCGRKRGEVGYLLAGAGMNINICDLCVSDAVSLIARLKAASLKKAPGS